MKIKQVIAETGLTDRAIRLYIENDLVKPECDENYNGRKSIDFSENDVKQLKDIALLRKADFSIQEIKALQMGGETARNTIKEYINRTNEKIQFNTEIIEKIGTLTDEENITIEIICEKLSSNLIDEKVPAEDMELSPKERCEKIIFTVISVIGMTIAAIFSVFFIYINLNLSRFPKFYEYEFETFDDMVLFPVFLFLRFFFSIQFLLCLAVALLYKKNKRIGKEKDRKKLIAIILTSIWCLTWIVFPAVFGGNLLSSPFYSQTENPNNYLQVDRDLNSDLDAIYEVFPATIPDSAVAEYSLLGETDKYPETTKYYYVCAPGFFHHRYDIYAEWQLPNEQEYDRAKKDVIENIDIVDEEIIGNWHCIYYYKNEQFDGENEYYYYLFFAYNDNTKTVRYIFASGSDTNTPYHLSLEW